MTALRKYLRLESSGLWRETPEARLRDVVVGLRDATLVLSDPKTEIALSQWSLPAVERLNPGKTPAIYGVGSDMAETLEIDDADMVAALDTVRSAIERRRPRQGRLRGWVMGLSGVTLLGLAVFWLPGKILDYTAAMLPAPTRSDLGADALADLAKLTGSPCSSKAGTAALQALSQRLGTEQSPLQIVVVRDALTQPVHLPGNVIVLPKPLIAAASGPDVVAGYVLAERLRSQITDPTRSVLRYAGLPAMLQLLTQGEIDPTALDGFGQDVLAQTPQAVPDEAVLMLFDAASVSSTAYAYALDASGETTLSLIEADPRRNGSAPPVLDDAAWQALQDICKI